MFQSTIILTERVIFYNFLFPFTFYYISRGFSYESTDLYFNIKSFLNYRKIRGWSKTIILNYKILLMFRWNLKVSLRVFSSNNINNVRKFLLFHTFKFVLVPWEHPSWTCCIFVEIFIHLKWWYFWWDDAQRKTFGCIQNFDHLLLTFTF